MIASFGDRKEWPALDDDFGHIGRRCSRRPKCRERGFDDGAGRAAGRRASPSPDTWSDFELERKATDALAHLR